VFVSAKRHKSENFSASDIAVPASVSSSPVKSSSSQSTHFHQSLIATKQQQLLSPHQQRPPSPFMAAANPLLSSKSPQSSILPPSPYLPSSGPPVNPLTPTLRPLTPALSNSLTPTLHPLTNGVNASQSFMLNPSLSLLSNAETIEKVSDPATSFENEPNRSTSTTRRAKFPKDILAAKELAAKELAAEKAAAAQKAALELAEAAAAEAAIAAATVTVESQIITEASEHQLSDIEPNLNLDDRLVSPHRISCDEKSVSSAKSTSNVTWPRCKDNLNRSGSRSQRNYVNFRFASN
jgi:hypothetical protein